MRITVKQLKELIREAVEESLSDEHVTGTYAHHDKVFGTTEPKYITGDVPTDELMLDYLHRYMKHEAAKGLSAEEIAKNLKMPITPEIIRAINKAISGTYAHRMGR
jgi:ribosome-binding protein aMBF1 (putative translation factor)